MTPELQEKIFRHNNSHHLLTVAETEALKQFLDAPGRERLAQIQRDDPLSASWWLCKMAHCHLAEREAQRLGLAPHATVALTHSPCVLIEIEYSEKGGHQLAERYGLKYQAPNSMWDVLDWRRDGDALIALVGDDRGWSNNWAAMIVVGWSPKWLAEKYETEGWVR